MDMIKAALKKYKMSVYRLSKVSDVPYTTLLEIINNKTSIENCSVKTMYKICSSLNISLNDLIESVFIYRMPFQEFRSEMCHKLKRQGDENFIKEILESNIIKKYYDKKWYEEALYLLSMIDYLSNDNNIPLVKDYDKYRHMKLNKTIYPRDIELISKIKKDNNIKKSANKNAIKEFKDHNIIEVNIRDVI